MKHATLFSGIGGPEIAAEWMGWKNVFHCEWNPFGKRVLEYYWPNAESYDDITKTDFTIWKGRVDVLTGGFPCQPYSTAGKRKGKEDERHLWPEMLRAIREIQPRWVVGENVLGIVNWNGGLVFDEVQADLETQGYEVFPFILPACGKNAPHRRDRVWFIAYSYGSKQRDNKGENGGKAKEVRKKKKSDVFGEFCSNGIITNSNSGRQSGKEHRKTQSGFPSEKSISNHWENFPTQSPVCDGDDGLSARLDGITFPKWRNESIKAGGNAIVPQVIFEIYKAISEYENLINSK